MPRKLAEERRICVTYLVIVAWLYAAAPPAVASSGRIMFGSRREEAPGLYVLDMESHGLILIRAKAGGAVWAPDGSRIAFAWRDNGSDNTDIYVMDMPGMPRRLTYHPGRDTLGSWSPDGSKIAFVSNRRDGYAEDVFVMNADGTNQRNLTPSRRTDSHPDWSPDGKRIVFHSMRDSTDVVGIPPEAERHEIYTMNADGSDPRRLTHDGWNVEPDWSHDGEWILFRRHDRLASGFFAMRPDGTDMRRVAEFGDASATSPVWSPDGTRIVFEWLIRPEGKGNQEIFVMDADGSNRVNLTNHPDGDMSPDWFDPRYSPAFTPAYRALFQWGWLKQFGRAR